METVPSRILAIMNERNMSYGELSKLTGIPKSTLQRYATAQTNKVPVDKVELIAKALNVEPSVLFGWATEEQAEHTEEEELLEYLEELRTRPEMKMLFQSSRNMTIEQVKAVVAMIENLRGE